MSAPRVVIVGAGISGLALAWRLHQRRPDVGVTVLEAADRPGGNVGTVERAGFRVETGPNGFLDTKPSTLRLCHDLGLGPPDLLPASEASGKHRFVFLNGRLQALPGSLWGFLTSPLLSLRGKLEALAEPLRPRGRMDRDESIAAFIGRRAGRAAVRVFADALVTGIHGGDPALLSMPAALPRAWGLAHQHGSLLRGFAAAAQERRRATPPGQAPGRAQMWSLRTGLGTLITRLSARLPTAPVLNASVNGVTKTASGWQVTCADGRAWAAEAVVLACPAPQQARLLGPVDAALATEVGRIAYAGIVVVAVGFRAEFVEHVPDGFGYIAPQTTRRDLLGVQWCSAIFPERAPPGQVLWRALCGGWHRPDVLQWSDAELLRAVCAELRLALGVQAPPTFTQIVRWPFAIPQYHVGHLARVGRIEQRQAAHAGLWLAGNTYRGVALNDCTEQAEVLAEQLTRTL
jgi:oxygen-dependent protoporphyrinogen oxidase